MKKTGVLFLLLSLAGCNLAAPLTSPSVADAIPADGAQNVAPGAAVKLELDLPNGGVNVTSVNPTSVTLTDVATGSNRSRRCTS